MSDTEKSTAPFDTEKDLPAPLADAIRNGSVDKSILQHAGDADEALKAFMSHPGQVIELDEATNKRLLRKIDWNLMPVRFFFLGIPHTDISHDANRASRSCVSSTD
jgi:ACS family allantoate permease-like MFS transporter